MLHTMPSVSFATRPDGTDSATPVETTGEIVFSRSALGLVVVAPDRAAAPVSELFGLRRVSERGSSSSPVASGIGSARPTGGGEMPSTCTACHPEPPAITVDGGRPRPRPRSRGVPRLAGRSAEPGRDDVTPPGSARPYLSRPSNIRTTHPECVGSLFEGGTSKIAAEVPPPPTPLPNPS